MAAYEDPATGGRLGSVMGSVSGGMEGLNEAGEEKGLAQYTLADFYANVQ